MTRKPVQARAKVTMETVVEAGFLVVAEHGLADTTTRHIADRAGIGVGSLYEYFADKEAIYAEMNKRLVAEVLAVLRPLLPQLVRMTPGEAVRTLLHAFRDLMLRDDSRYLKYLRRVGLISLHGEIEPIERALMDLVTQFLLQQPEATRVRHLRTMSYIFINGGIFTVLRHLSDSDPPISFDELADGLARMVSHYLSHELGLPLDSPLTR